MLSAKDKFYKRFFDIVIAVIGILIFIIPIIFLVVIASFSTQSFGLFVQKRIGQFQQPFYIFKIRSMVVNKDKNSFTASNDERITLFGQFIRKYKLDELPQFLNVLIGNMSIVGPRPNVEEMLLQYTEEEKIIFQMKPGLICDATLKYINEETLLATKDDIHHFYLTKIWPQKVQLNMDYIQNWTLKHDFEIIFKFLLIIFRLPFRSIKRYLAF